MSLNEELESISRKTRASLKLKFYQNILMASKANITVRLTENADKHHFLYLYPVDSELLSELMSKTFNIPENFTGKASQEQEISQISVQNTDNISEKVAEQNVEKTANNSVNKTESDKVIIDGIRLRNSRIMELFTLKLFQKELLADIIVWLQKQKVNVKLYKTSDKIPVGKRIIPVTLNGMQVNIVRNNRKDVKIL